MNKEFQIIFFLTLRCKLETFCKFSPKLTALSSDFFFLKASSDFNSNFLATVVHHVRLSKPQDKPWLRCGINESFTWLSQKNPNHLRRGEKERESWIRPHSSSRSPPSTLSKKTLNISSRTLSNFPFGNSSEFVHTIQSIEFLRELHRKMGFSWENGAGFFRSTIYGSIDRTLGEFPILF